MTKSRKISSKLKPQVNINMQMTSLQLISLGEKGGVGKTWLSLILIELLRSTYGKLPTIIDMDVSTPNIAKIYQKENYATWLNTGVKEAKEAKDKDNDEDNDIDLDALTKVYSETTDQSGDISELLKEQIFLGGGESAEMGDKLLEIMNSSPQSVTCFPSQSQKGLNKWLDDNGIGKSKTDSNMIFWWVSDGSFESLELFQNFIKKYPHLKCCLVLNRGVNVRIWNKYSLHQMNPTLSEKIADKTLKAIFIDAIDIERTIMIDIQNKGVSFQDIIENKGDRYNKYFVNRFKIWLEKSFKAIKKTGYIIDKEHNSSTDTADNNLPLATADTSST
jgi:CobQ/CobB/MinD/ParA nucleotide binding domain